MTKQELIDFLEPFDPDIMVLVRGVDKKLTYQVSYDLEYIPFTDDRSAIVVINVPSVGINNAD